MSKGFDDRGFPTTIYPSNCPTSNFPMKAGEVLGTNSMLQTTPGPTIVSTSTMAAGSGQAVTTGGFAMWAVGCGALVAALGFAVVLA